MKIGIKKRSVFGVKKITLEGKITRVEEKASKLTPDRKHFFVFFKGIEGLGIIQLSSKEKEMLAKKITGKKKNKATKK